MKIREFVQGGYDVDVYDNIESDFCIAACCPIYLTSNGEEEFALALDCEIELTGPGEWGEETAMVMIDKNKPWVDQKADLFNVIKFFNAAAGYCSEENDRRWFK